MNSVGGECSGANVARRGLTRSTLRWTALSSLRVKREGEIPCLDILLAAVSLQPRVAFLETQSIVSLFRNFLSLPLALAKIANYAIPKNQHNRYIFLSKVMGLIL